MGNPNPRFDEKLNQWLDVATEGLVIGAKERIRAEIESHYADTFNRLLSEGKSAPEARSEAIARLGDPATAASGFRAKHLTEARAQKLKTLAKAFIGAGVLMPVFLLVGGGYLTSSNASFAVSLFLGSYLCGLLLPGLLLLRGFKSDTVGVDPMTSNPARDALKNKMSRTKFLAVAAVLAFYMLVFVLLPRYVFSSNLGVNLFTVIQALVWSSLLMYGIGVSRRIRRVTISAA
jgi:hypothetical protein